MAVYVDNAQIRYGRMKMNHMLADSAAELHAMADKIGVARKWFQGMASSPHYDICNEKRALAVAAGAQQVTRHQLAEVIRRINSNKTSWRIRKGGWYSL